MKNASKAFSLLLSAAALVSIASCGQPVSSKANTLVSYTDNSGAKVDFTTNELLLNYLNKDTTASVEEYYNIAYDAMVRKYFEGKTDVLEGIKLDAKNEVKNKKQQAETAANTNKTKYEDEWKSILDSELSNLKESRRTEAKLLDKYELAKMREKVADDFYDTFKDYNKKAHEGDALQKEFNIFWGDNGYLEKRIPYHVKHILVKVGAADGALYNGEITSDNAKKLSLVITSLAKGLDFGDVAKLQSDDSSNSSFGNLGIMDTATSFVNEFKLGTYVYDTLFNNNAGVAEEAKNDPFNMNKEKDFFEQLGVAEIPYGAVKDLAKYSDITENKDGKKVNEDNPLFYPRNILFNKYFNNHNFGFIVLKDSDAKKLGEDGYTLTENKTTDGKNYYSDLDSKGKWTNVDYAYDASNPNDVKFKDDPALLKGFKDITFKDGKERKVLCDDNGNPILVVRAGTADYQGLHLISVERSGLEKTATYKANIGTDKVPNYVEYKSTLEQYYTAINPREINEKLNPNFPTINADSKVQQKTYINNVVSKYNEYNQRVDTLKNTIKNFDPSYDKKVFNWLKTLPGVGAESIIIKVKVNGVETPIDITKKIDKYVNREIAEHNTSAFTISDETWEGYADYLRNQEAERKTKLIPETCALGFWDGTGYENKDSICSYSKESK